MSDQLSDLLRAYAGSANSDNAKFIRWAADEAQKLEAERDALRELIAKIATKQAAPVVLTEALTADEVALMVKCAAKGGSGE